MPKYRWRKMPNTYQPWKTIGVKRYGDSIRVEDLEHACPVILKCSEEWMRAKRKEVGRREWVTEWYSHYRDFFHRNIGCFTEWANCESVEEDKDIRT